MATEQQEELEVLQSIYEGDENFRILQPTQFTYKICEDEDELKHFLVEISWPPEYPHKLPEVNLDVFFNKHLSESTKMSIQSALLEQAGASLGDAMTFTLFEWTKENGSELMANNDPGALAFKDKDEDEVPASIGESDSTIKKIKKEVLTKAQKRRRADRLGEQPRGWDWVDIIKHLSQTGSKSNS